MRLLDGLFLARDALLGKAGVFRLRPRTGSLAGELEPEQIMLAAHLLAQFLVEEAAFAHGEKKSRVESRQLTVNQWRTSDSTLSFQLLTVDC